MSDFRPSRRITALEAVTGVVIFVVGVSFMLAGHLLERGVGEILNEAGFVLVGTVTVTFVYEFVLRRQHDEYVTRLVAGSLISQAPQYGLTGIETRLVFQGLFESLRRGDELLWLDTYCPDQPNFQEALRDAVNRGASVRMLAVRPEADVAQFRAREIRKDLGYSVTRFRDEARGQIEHLREALADTAEPVRANVRLRYYSDLPCIPMYIHVRKGRPYAAFTSFFLQNPTFAEPHLRWGPSSAGFLERFYEYFNAKWDAQADHEEDLFGHLREVDQT